MMDGILDAELSAAEIADFAFGRLVALALALSAVVAIRLCCGLL